MRGSVRRAARSTQAAAVALSVLISAWLVGALGGVHCLAMCGGLLAAVGTREAMTQPLLPARAVARRQFAYQAGRVATYTVLGIALGSAGALALSAAALSPLQRLLYLAANLFLLLLGLHTAFATPGIAWLQRAGAAAFGGVLRHMRPLLRHSGIAGRLALGLVWGLVPCALVYSVLPLALFAGGAWQGGAVMFAFGIGTVPNLLAAGVLISRARGIVERNTLRYAAGALLTVFALIGIWRVLFDPAAMAKGPFCLGS